MPFVTEGTEDRMAQTDKVTTDEHFSDKESKDVEKEDSDDSRRSGSNTSQELIHAPAENGMIMR